MGAKRALIAPAGAPGLSDADPRPFQGLARRRLASGPVTTVAAAIHRSNSMALWWQKLRSSNPMAAFPGVKPFQYPVCGDF